MTYASAEIAKMEGEIATLIAKVSASPSYLRHAKEPYDTPTNMTPVAYAFFEVLVGSGEGSGQEYDWHQFLRDALEEVISAHNAPQQ